MTEGAERMYPEFASVTRGRIASLALAAALAALAGCGGNDSGPAAPPGAGDPGPVHAHGLGIDPKDGALLVATHTGLFRAPPGETRMERVGERMQDTMGFTVVGPNTILGSGHPDGRDELPPFLGLIRSDDGGRSWRPVSLLGKRDFHVLEAEGRRVYGYGSDFATRSSGFLVSDDGGRSWEQREVPEPLVALALDPADADRLIASGVRALHVSDDGGRRWRPLEGPPGLLAWGESLIVVDAGGTVHRAEDPPDRLRPVGDVGGAPAALDVGQSDDLYLALHDGTVKRSVDGGAGWSVRAAP